jgi:hypothetical protein
MSRDQRFNPRHQHEVGSGERVFVCPQTSAGLLDVGSGMVIVERKFIFEELPASTLRTLLKVSLDARP